MVMVDSSYKIATHKPENEATNAETPVAEERADEPQVDNTVLENQPEQVVENPEPVHETKEEVDSDQGFEELFDKLHGSRDEVSTEDLLDQVINDRIEIPVIVHESDKAPDDTFSNAKGIPNDIGEHKVDVRPSDHVIEGPRTPLMMTPVLGLPLVVWCLLLSLLSMYMLHVASSNEENNTVSSKQNAGT